MDDQLATQLIRDEGMVLHAYQDSLGYWTIGVGRLIDPKKGGGISETEALLLLHNDIQKARTALLAALPWASQLDEVRQGALIAMAFNMGIGGLLEFKNTLQLVKNGQFAAASGEMLKSRWAQQVGARANRLARQIATGEWQ